MTDRRKAIAYIRTSTKRQVLSLDVQRHAIECWASLAGVDVVEWHTDRGVSGALPMGKRAGLSAAMDTIADNENIRILVTAHRDRLTRDPASAEEIYKQLSLCEVEFVAVDETITSSAVSRFRQHMTLSIGEYKAAIEHKPAEPTALDHLRELGVPLGGVSGGADVVPGDGRRIMASVKSEAGAVADLLYANQNRARHNGRHPAHPPFGYRLDADGVRLVADEGEQSVIARVRAARAAGLTMRDIADALRRAGVVRAA